MPTLDAVVANLRILCAASRNDITRPTAHDFLAGTVLRRMEAHMTKKGPELRALSTWTGAS